MKSDSESPSQLVSGPRLAKNTLWNILGQGLPLLVGLGAIPFLIHGLGIDRFGVLTIAWMVIGYFSIFDFGLGRALTKLTAERLGAGNTKEIPELLWTALLLMGVLGIAGGLVVAGISHWLVYGVLNVPVELREETLYAFYLLALSIPLVIGTTGLRGILEAYQRFGLVNAVRIPLGLWTFLGPLIVLEFSESLYHIVSVLVVGRVIALVAHFGLCFYVVPALRNGIVIKRHLIVPLMSFGGWMTVSNTIGPIMVYMDRFLIGAIVSMAAVAYYTTPYEVVTKLWMIPIALVSVLFPAFSSTFVNDKVTAANLFDRGTKYIFIVMFPVILVVITFAYEGLELWLGLEFAINGFAILQWLAIGVFINSLARVPFALIQGAGRPDIIAITHLLELPLYLILLWWLLGLYGIEGAAAAWTIRIVADTVIFNLVTAKLLVESMPFIRKNALNAIYALAVLLVPVVISDLLLKSVFLIGVLFAFSFWSWKFLLCDHERDFVKKTVLLRKMG
ncbi:MAG: flippase [Gammaproteobacteria bacterium]|nr:flippase [Gammaproteobacteria bacterium]